MRTTDAETVESRWLNRLKNLMLGLPGQNGPDAVAEMQARGQSWLRKSAKLETPIETDRATRPAPKPPVEARPRSLSVSDIRTLIRDPFAIYAKYCLDLARLGPLVPQADAMARGIVAHDILERFIKATLEDPANLKPEVLHRFAREALDRTVPWPAARVLWLAKLDNVAAWFLEGEQDRRQRGTAAAFEASGSLRYPRLATEIRARADRIDATSDGAVIVYDYKTGAPKPAKQQRQFEPQLLIEAAMVEAGSFTALGPRAVAAAQYIGLGANPKVENAPLQEEPPDQVLRRLESLLDAYLDPAKGYTSRRAAFKDSQEGDYDLLARYGEWEASAEPDPVAL